MYISVYVLQHSLCIFHGYEVIQIQILIVIVILFLSQGQPW